MTKRPLSLEEQRAWARVARSIKPLASTPLSPAADAELMEDALSAMLSPAQSPPIRKADQTIARQSAPRPASLTNRGNERRVRKGQTVIAAQFDLHGHTQESAARALPAFLERSRVGGARCVLVITGKGQRGEGVLRRNFLHWMQSAQALTIVSGYAEAHRKHGGSGAFYVFLRHARV